MYERIRVIPSTLEGAGEPLKHFSSYPFSGFYARHGLIRVQDKTFDSEYAFNEIQLYDSKGNTVNGGDHESFFAEHNGANWDGFYGNYYGRRNQTPKLASTTGTGSALLLHDSYGNAFKRPLASNYAVTYMESDIHNLSKSEDMTLANRISSTDADDVVFVASTGDYASQKKRMPNYF